MEDIIFHIWTLNDLNVYDWDTFFDQLIIQHNESGPACIEYNENTGNITTLQWCINNLKHRIKKPAHFTFHSNGNIRYIGYYYKHFNHNEDGPARIWYTIEGEIRTNEWYLYAKYISKTNDDFISYIKEHESQIYAKLMKKISINIFD